MTTAQDIDVSALIEQRPVTSFQWRTLFVCLTVLFMDGYDAQAIGYVAPALVQAWHLDRAALGPVFAIGLLGMMFGGLFFGPLADRFGRKRFIVVCTAAFGLFSLLTAFAETPSQMMLLRLLTGLGLGGAMPNAVALAVEYFPKRRRASAVTMVFVGFTIGAAVGGFAIAGLLQAYGWPVVFVIGGVIPLVLVPLLLVMLPESLTFLILRDRPQAEILHYLLRLAPDLRIGDAPRFMVQEETGRGVPVKHLFTQGRAMPTLLLWVLFFLALMITYILASWTPIAFNAAGVPVAIAVSATGMWQTGSIVGTLSVGQLMDRFEPFKVLAIGFVVSACAVLLMTQVDGTMSADVDHGHHAVLRHLHGYRRAAGRQRAGRLVLSGLHPHHGSRLGYRHGTPRLDCRNASRRADPFATLATANHLPRRYNRAGAGLDRRAGGSLLRTAQGRGDRGSG